MDRQAGHAGSEPKAPRLVEVPLPVPSPSFPGVSRRQGQQPIRLFGDHPKEILTRHDYGSHGVHYTLNPYRGCTFGCVYCSARPRHEYLGDASGAFNSGPDFDSKIVARKDAARLLDETLSRKRMHGRAIQLSGATDPYQPLEEALKITRGCLEVCLHHGNPVALQTKSQLVLRDLDLFTALQRGPGVHVAISLAALDEQRALALEPGCPTPHERIAIMERLANAGVPIGVSIAPAILGLTDTDIVRILTLAKDAGATTAFYLRLRLPGLVEPQLVRRVKSSLPDRARRVVEGLGGYGAAPGRRGDDGGRARTRMPADDPMEQIFAFTCERLGLAFERGAPWPSTVAHLEARAQPADEPAPAVAQKTAPTPPTQQLSLF